MIIQLKDYQTRLISDTRNELIKGVKGVLMQSPTGSGKTFTTAFMFREAFLKGKSAWFVVHREELIKQSSAAFDKINLPHGIVCAGWPIDVTKKIQVCSIMSLKNRLNKLARPDMIVYDECQYMGAKTWDDIFESYPNSVHIGLSATPWRLDGKGFTKYFQRMVKGPSVKWLIENKHLSDYKVFAPANYDFSKFKISKGDYDQTEIDEFLNKPTIIGDCFANWSKYAYGKKTIAFSPSVSFSKNLVEQFMKNGINAVHLDGETPSLERDSAVRKFASGEITFLSNCNLFVEGFDVPSAEALINCKPTKSLAKYLQIVGRILRFVEGKTAIIIDQVSSCVEHGLPCDEYLWSLEDRKKKKKKSDDSKEKPVKICESCLAANNSMDRFCTNCGAPFVILKRSGPEQIDGDLAEVDKIAFKNKRKEQEKKAKTLDELIAVGIDRGYKNPAFWAKMKFKNGWRGKS